MSGTGEHDEGSGSGPLEPVPDDVLERARHAFAQRAAGPIAKLVSDSLVDEGDAPESHVLLFEADAVRIELRVEAGRSQSHLRGTVAGLTTSRASLHLEGSELALVTRVDGGSFGFDPVARGVVRISFETPGAPSLVTDWFQV